MTPLKKDPEIKNLILVRRREEDQLAEITIENNPEEEGNIVEPVVNNDEEEQVAVNVELVENVLRNNDEELSKKYKELEHYFQLGLENLNHSTLLHIEPREKLPKVKMSDEIQKEQIKSSVCIYQVLIPNQRLPASYMQWEKPLDMQVE